MLFFFPPMYVSGTGTLGNVQILSLAALHSPNIKVNSAIQCLQLVFLKSKNDESLAVYVYKFTPIMVRNNFHLFVNKHVACLTWVFTTRDYFGGNNKLYRSKLLFFFTLF